MNQLKHTFIISIIIIGQCYLSHRHNPCICVVLIISETLFCRQDYMINKSFNISNRSIDNDLKIITFVRYFSSLVHRSDWQCIYSWAVQQSFCDQNSYCHRFFRKRTAQRAEQINILLNIEVSAMSPMECLSDMFTDKVIRRVVSGWPATSSIYIWFNITEKIN